MDVAVIANCSAALGAQLAEPSHNPDVCLRLKRTGLAPLETEIRDVDFGAAEQGYPAARRADEEWRRERSLCL